MGTGSSCAVASHNQQCPLVAARAVSLCSSLAVGHVCPPPCQVASYLALPARPMHLAATGQPASNSFPPPLPPESLPLRGRSSCRRWWGPACLTSRRPPRWAGGRAAPPRSGHHPSAVAVGVVPCPAAGPGLTLAQNASATSPPTPHHHCLLSFAERRLAAVFEGGARPGDRRVRHRQLRLQVGLPCSCHGSFGRRPCLCSG